MIKPKVIIIWKNDSKSDNINVLAWNSGNGLPRIYDKDCLDYRITIGSDNPPYFDNALSALEYINSKEGLKGVCQLDVKVAPEFGICLTEDVTLH